MTRIFRLGALVLISGLGILYFCLDPSAYILFPKCPFLMMTGLECPGCGSQRAIHNLLHLNIKEAIHCNALLVFSIPVIGICLYAEHRCTQNSGLYRFLHRPSFAWSIAGIIVAWWILRNISKINSI